MSGDPLSIVILTHNTRSLLAACLASIQKFAPTAQVIVVDNASNDGSVEMVAREFPQALLVPNSANVGFARAINLGAHRARGQFIFTLNADTELLATTIGPLLETMSQQPRAGIVAPMQCLPNPTAADQPGKALATAFPDPTLAREALRLIFFSDSFASRLRRGPWRPLSGAPRAVDYLLGAALLFRRECWDALCGFDETQFMYGEDWDICYRARHLGWQVLLAPDAQIIHHEMASSKQTLGVLRAARVLKGNLYYYEKHYGPLRRRVLSLLHAKGAALRLIVLAPLALLSPKTFKPRMKAQSELGRVAWRGIWSR